uniref:Uncharacterized protein n=1 Tax=Anguilla anguilla TaxID=7936 RepID=A0A0E9Y2P4_ANGAN
MGSLKIFLQQTYILHL